MYDRSNVSPEVKQGRRSGNSAADGYAQALPGSLAAMGAFGAAAGGVHALMKGGPALVSVGLLGTAGLLAGALVGGITGATRGGRAAHETFDPKIGADVDKLMERFDLDKDGNVSIDVPAGAMPEFMYRNGLTPDIYTGTTGISSIEQIARRADVDSSGSASRQEIVDLFTSFDASGNDKLNGEERGAMHAEGLYERL